MMRTMRAKAKWVFLIVAGSFVLWLGVGQVMEILGPSGSVVLRVNGRDVQIMQFQQRLQNAREQIRQQFGTMPVTLEAERELQDQVVAQLVDSILLHDEYRRLGIRATDAEVIEAARTSPPAEVMQDPQFHTDGQFDITKWQRFLQSGADPSVLLQLEAIYRDRIRQIKLAQYITAGVYVSDAQLWQMYKDQHDSVRVAVLPVWPAQLTESSPVSDAELRRYVEEHEEDFTRPATAFVRFIAQPRVPNAADSAAARVRIARIRAELARGVSFDSVARGESGDTVSGQRGGEIGWIRRNATGFDQQFLAGLRGLRPGQLSQPVQTDFGLHLIRVDSARGDSVKVRHILVALEPQGEHLDYVEARADSLERFAAEQTDPAVLDSAARRFGLPLSPLQRVMDGEPFHLGRYVIPDVSVWAFDAQIGETSHVIEARPAYFVFRLDSLVPAGVPPLAQIRREVEARVRLERQREIARRHADSLAAALRDARTVPGAATFGPFARTQPPSYLAREPLVVGAAFGLEPGRRSGAIAGENGFFIMQSLGRTLADSAKWLAQRDAQRRQVLNLSRQARFEQHIAGLRAQAKVVDRRKEIFRAQAEEPINLGF